MKMPFSILLLISIVTFSCKPLYLPNTVNVPGINASQQLNASLISSANGFNLQGAYSPYQHVALMANGAFNSSGAIQHLFGELGLGYYLSTESRLCVDVYAGFGGGHTAATETSFGGTTYNEGKYNRFFIQPNIGSKTDHLEVYLSPRISFVNMYDRNFIQSGGTRQKATFFEPALTFKTGSKRVKGMAQVGLSFPMRNNTQQDLFEYQPFLMSIGVGVSLGTKSKTN